MSAQCTLRKVELFFLIFSNVKQTSKIKNFDMEL